MPRLKKWEEGEFLHIKVKVDKGIGKRFKSWCGFKGKTMQEELETHIINTVTKK